MELTSEISVSKAKSLRYTNAALVITLKLFTQTRTAANFYAVHAMAPVKVCMMELDACLVVGSGVVIEEVDDYEEDMD
jgi:hypothetical protein